MSQELSTEPPITASPETQAGQNRVDNANTLVPVRPAARWKRQLCTGCYLAVCAIAMIAWLTALGWAATAFASWMLL